MFAELKQKVRQGISNTPRRVKEQLVEVSGDAANASALGTAASHTVSQYALSSDAEVSFSGDDDMSVSTFDMSTDRVQVVTKEDLFRKYQRLLQRTYRNKTKFSQVIKALQESDEEKAKLTKTLQESQDKFIDRIDAMKKQLEYEKRTHELATEENQLIISTLRTQNDILKQCVDGSDDGNRHTRFTDALMASGFEECNFVLDHAQSNSIADIEARHMAEISVLKEKAESNAKEHEQQISDLQRQISGLLGENNLLQQKCSQFHVQLENLRTTSEEALSQLVERHSEEVKSHERRRAADAVRWSNVIERFVKDITLLRNEIAGGMANVVSTYHEDVRCIETELSNLNRLHSTTVHRLSLHHANEIKLFDEQLACLKSNRDEDQAEAAEKLSSTIMESDDRAAQANADLQLVDSTHEMALSDMLIEQQKEMNSEITHLQEINKQLSDELSVLIVEKDRVSEEMRCMKEHHSSMLDSRSKEHVKLQNDVRRSEAKIEELLREQLELKLVNENLVKEAQETEQVVLEMSLKAEERRKDAELSKEEIAHLQKDIDVLRAKLSTVCDAHELEKTRICEQSIHEIESLNNQVNELNMHLKHERDSTSHLNEVLKEETMRKMELSQEIDHIKSNSLSSIEELTLQIKCLGDELSASKNNVSFLEKTIADVKDANKLLNEQVSHYECELEGLESVEMKRKSIDDELKAVRWELSCAKDQVNELEQIKSLLEEKCHENTVQQDSLQKQVLELREVNCGLLNKVNELTASLESMTSLLDTANCENSSNQVKYDTMMESNTALISSLQCQLCDTANSLQELQQEMLHLKSSIGGLTSENNTLSQSNSSLQNELAEVKERWLLVNGELKTATDHNESLRNQLEDAKNQNELLSKKLYDVEETCRSKDIQLRDLINQNNELKSDSQAYAEKLRQVIFQVEGLESENKSLRDRLSDHINRVDREQCQVHEMQVDLEQQKEALIIELERAKALQAMQENENTGLASELSKVKNALDEAENKISHLNSRLQQSWEEKSSHDEHIQKLEDERRSLQQVIEDQKEAHISELKQAELLQASLTVENVEVKRELDTVRVALSASESVSKQLNIEKQQLTNENTSLRERSLMLDDELQSAKMGIVEKEEAFQQKKSILASLEEENFKLNNELVRSRTELEDSRLNLLRLQDLEKGLELQQTETKMEEFRLKELVSNLERDNERISRELREFQELCSSITASRDQLMSENNALSAHEVEVMQLVRGLEDQIAEFIKKEESLSSKLLVAEKDYSDVKKECLEFEMQLADANQLSSVLKERVDELKFELLEAEKNNKSLSDELTSFKSVNESLTNQVSKFEESSVDVDLAFQELRSQNISLQDKQKKIKEHNEDLKMQLLQCKDNNEAILRDLEEVKDINESLKCEVEEHRKHRTDMIGQLEEEKMKTETLNSSLQHQKTVFQKLRKKQELFSKEMEALRRQNESLSTSQNDLVSSRAHARNVQNGLHRLLRACESLTSSQSIVECDVTLGCQAETVCENRFGFVGLSDPTGTESLATADCRDSVVSENAESHQLEINDLTSRIINVEDRLVQSFQAWRSAVSYCQKCLDAFNSLFEKPDSPVANLAKNYVICEQDESATAELEATVMKVSGNDGDVVNNSSSEELRLNIISKCKLFEERLNKLESLMTELKKRLAENEGILKQKDQQLAAVEELSDSKVMEVKKKCLAKMKDLRSSHVEQKNKIDRLTGELSAAKEVISAFDARVKELSMSQGELERKYEESIGHIEKKDSIINEHLRLMNSLVHNQGQVVGEFDQVNGSDEFNIAWLAVQSTISEYQTKISEANCRILELELRLEASDKSKDELVLETKGQLSDLKRRAETRLGQIKRQLQSDKESALKEMQDVVDDLRAKLSVAEAERADSGRLLTDSQRQFSELVESTSGELADLRRIIEDKDNKIGPLETALTLKLSESENRRAELAETLQAHEEAAAIRLKEELQKMKSEWKNKLKDAENDHNGKVKQLVKEFSIKLAEKDQEHLKGYHDILEKSQREEDRMRLEHKKELKELQREVVEKEEAIDNLSQQLENKEQEMEAQFQIERKKFNERIDLLDSLLVECQKELDEEKSKAENRSQPDGSDVEPPQGKADGDQICAKIPPRMEADLRLQVVSLTKLIEELKITHSMQIVYLENQLDAAAMHSRRTRSSTSRYPRSGTEDKSDTDRLLRAVERQCTSLQKQLIHLSGENAMLKMREDELVHQVKNLTQADSVDGVQRPSESSTSNFNVEREYLKNILFPYMIGTESKTLAKVICTVMKYTDEQTQIILDRQPSIT